MIRMPYCVQITVPDTSVAGRPNRARIGELVELLLTILDRFEMPGSSFPVQIKPEGSSVFLIIPPRQWDRWLAVQTGQALNWTWPQLRAVQHMHAFADAQGWIVSLRFNTHVWPFCAPITRRLPPDFATFEKNFTDDQLERLLSLSGPDRRSFLAPPMKWIVRPVPAQLTLRPKDLVERRRVYGDLL